MMNETKNQVSLNNGNTFVMVADLTDEQITRVIDDINASSNVDRVADALNATSGTGDNAANGWRRFWQNSAKIGSSANFKNGGESPRK